MATSSLLVLVTCCMHLRSANVRWPVPKVRCESRHDLEIQGRFPAFSDGHIDVVGRVGRIERPWRKNFASFLHDF